MIQDIAPSKLYNEFKIKELPDLHTPLADSKILIYERREVLLNENFELPTFAEWREWFGDNEMIRELHNGIAYGEDLELRYLFSIDQIRFFLFFPTKAGITATQLLGEDLHGYRFENIRNSMWKVPVPDGHAVSTGFHLHTWYGKHRICGCCGKVLVHDENERMMKCPDCKNMYFPMIAPACIIAVTNGDKENPKILLSKYANRGYKRYALLAGFIEIGETAEEAVKREVMEEVGLKVKNIRYYKTQPWGVDSNLLLGFFCELEQDGEIIIDHEELAMAEWKSPSEVPTDMGNVSLTGEMMEVFVRENE